MNMNVRRFRSMIEARKEFMVIGVALLALIAFKVFFEFGTNIGEFIYYIAH